MDEINFRLINLRKLHEQILVILKNKFGSTWCRKKAGNFSNTCKIEKYNCIKDKGCRSFCKVMIDHKTKIATIYWNEMEHNHQL